VGKEYKTEFRVKKKVNPSTRETNTPLFLLRAVQLGLSMEDLDYLTLGMVFDMMTERGNDEYEYPQKATQDNFDDF